MKNIKIEVNIDGDNYSEKQLQQIKFEREKHVLQEMIHLGAVISFKGNQLTYDDVNYLSYEDAETLTLNTKLEIGTEGIRELYSESLERSAQMWRDIVKDYSSNDELLVATGDLLVSGMSLNQFKEKLAFVLSGGDASVMSEHPEHFQFTMIENNQMEKIGMETMGMYGGPTEVIVMMGDKTLNSRVPKNDDFPPAPCGTSKLVDGTLRKDIAHHQMKETEDGFDLRTTVYFPKNTPKELVEGHKLHLVMEAYEMICAAAEY